MAKRDLQSKVKVLTAETVNLTVVGDVGNKVQVGSGIDTQGFNLGFAQALEYSRVIVDPTDDVKFLYELSDDGGSTWVEVSEGVLPTAQPYAVEPDSGFQQVIGLGGHEGALVRLVLDVVALSADLDITITTIQSPEVKASILDTDQP